MGSESSDSCRSLAGNRIVPAAALAGCSPRFGGGGASGFRGRDRLPERFAGGTRLQKAVREPAFRPSLYSGACHGRGLSSSASSGRSRANQAAAIFSISRRMARSSRKRRISSPASLSCICSAANVSGVRPCSRSARATQFRIACALGSNSRESSSGLLPCRTRSIICWRNSGEYRRPVPLIWLSSRIRPDGPVPPGAWPATPYSRDAS